MKTIHYKSRRGRRFGGSSVFEWADYIGNRIDKVASTINDYAEKKGHIKSVSSYRTPYSKRLSIAEKKGRRIDDRPEVVKKYSRQLAFTQNQLLQIRQNPELKKKYAALKDRSKKMTYSQRVSARSAFVSLLKKKGKDEKEKKKKDKKTTKKTTKKTKKLDKLMLDAERERKKAKRAKEKKQQKEERARRKAERKLTRELKKNPMQAP